MISEGYGVRPRITVVGSINTDLNVNVEGFASPGETVIARESALTPGGKGANQACVAALLGGAVRLVGAVGSDPNREIALDRLRAVGVNLSSVETTIEKPTGLAIVTLDEDGENAITVIPGANYAVTEEFILKHREAMQTAEVVVVQAEIPRESIEAVIKLSDSRVVFNLAPYTDVSIEILRKANPLVVNEHEATALHKACGFAPVHDVDFYKLGQDLHGLGIPSVVITLGRNGAVVIREDGSQVHVPSCSVPTVDTTGAGDAFVGALGYMLGRDKDLKTAVRYATSVAGFSVQRLGAQTSYPGVSDVLPSLEASTEWVGS